MRERWRTDAEMLMRKRDARVESRACAAQHLLALCRAWRRQSRALNACYKPRCKSVRSGSSGASALRASQCVPSALLRQTRKEPQSQVYGMPCASRAPRAIWRAAAALRIHRLTIAMRKVQKARHFSEVPCRAVSQCVRSDAACASRRRSRYRRILRRARRSTKRRRQSAGGARYRRLGSKIAAYARQKAGSAFSSRDASRRHRRPERSMCCSVRPMKREAHARQAKGRGNAQLERGHARGVTARCVRTHRPPPAIPDDDAYVVRCSRLASLLLFTPMSLPRTDEGHLPATALFDTTMPLPSIIYAAPPHACLLPYPAQQAYISDDMARHAKMACAIGAMRRRMFSARICRAIHFIVIYARLLCTRTRCYARACAVAARR